MLKIIGYSTADNLVKSSVELIINKIAVPARIIGGVLIVLSVCLVALQMIVSRKAEQRAMHMEALIYICLGAFILGAMFMFLGFFNTIVK